MVQNCQKVFGVVCNYVMSFTGVKVSISIPCACCVWRREQRKVDTGSIRSGRESAGIIPAGRQLPVGLQLLFENPQLMLPRR